MRLTEVVVLVAIAVGICGCKMADEDRCTSEYEWHPDEAACVLPEPKSTGEPQDTSDADTDTDTDAQDASVQDSDTQEEGLGMACRTDTDCKGYIADTCLLDPTNPDADGMCSIADCTAEDCSLEFQCCDCEGVTLLGWEVPYCLDPDSAGLLAGFCTCE